MLLSASRRTDIPCHFADWFMQRIREGFVLTRNPMNHAQLSRIPLSPDIVDCIIFWTKDPAGILPHLDEFDERGYRYYFQFTLTPYDSDIEANLRPKDKIEQSFIALSKRIGSKSIVWRYDPILVNDSIDLAYHAYHFNRLCELLSPYCQSVTISFLDFYAKLHSSLLRPITEDEIVNLASMIADTARTYRLPVHACCEKLDLTPYGIAPAACIDKAMIEQICESPLKLSPDKNQRPGCGCCESVDIGAYNTCINGCIYCYANNSPSAAVRRYTAHDPNSPILFGRVAEGECITEKKLQSNLIRQQVLF
ncbi:MAG: DUF1848 domain-containing protein [Clostridia bacterium]|nr:DUF1848 domain-containing protein [Clostridia bacterium]